MFVNDFFCRVSPATTFADPVKACLVTSPKPVITTSSSAVDEVNATSTLEPVTETSCVT